jgi:hypothetical protein
MTIISKLATSLQRRDEMPNKALAAQIAEKNNSKAVAELVENLHNKSKDIQNDCIKVLYEIGAIKPALISAYATDIIGMLDTSNNRMQWGAMTALDMITLEEPKSIYAALPKIIETANNGSIITKDHGVNILIKLCSVKQYADAAFPLLMEQILNSPVNQLPMYAERSIPVITESNKDKFIKALTSRLEDIEKESKKSRVEKVIKKIKASGNA